MHYVQVWYRLSWEPRKPGKVAECAVKRSTVLRSLSGQLTDGEMGTVLGNIGNQHLTNMQQMPLLS